MRSSVLGILALCFCSFTTGLIAQDAITDKSTGMAFPGEVSFDNNGMQYQLQATGVATRKKLIIKVYSIASYLQKGAAGSGDKFDKILSDDNAKQLTLKYVRDITANQIQDAFQDSFRRVFPGQEYTKLQADITSFLHFFNKGVHRGEEFAFRWIPGGSVEVLINGSKVGSINNVAFAQGLWKVWFGQNSIVDRNDLVSLMK